MQYLNLAMQVFQKGLCHSRPTDTRPAKRDSRGQIKDNRGVVMDPGSFSVPFGSHLTPVPCQQVHSAEPRTTKDPKGSSDAAQRTTLGLAVGAHQSKHDCRPGLTQSRPCDPAHGITENSSEDFKEPIYRTVTTNDLLDCLVHPDIIAQVIQLLLERHMGNQQTATQSQLQYSEGVSDEWL